MVQSVSVTDLLCPASDRNHGEGAPRAIAINDNPHDGVQLDVIIRGCDVTVHIVGDAPAHAHTNARSEFRWEEKAIAVGVFGAPGIFRASSQP